MARAARVARVARPRAPTRVARRRRFRSRAAPREDADARIDLRASVEDRVKKAREYAAAMERARAEGDGGDRDDAMEASTTDGTFAGETASDGATGATRPVDMHLKKN